jgi:hypothetical protein
MIGFAFEQGGTVVRVPTVRIGDLQLTEVGILGSSPANGSPVDRTLDGIFWRGWGKGAARPVIGWLGGNAFRDYRLTLDYKNHVAYWLKVSEPDTSDLNSVGVSLVHTPTAYVVGGLARVHGAASVSGVAVGDQLLAIDGQDVTPLAHGAVIQALHGAPGDHRRLTLERKGQTIQVDAVVTRY